MESVGFEASLVHRLGKPLARNPVIAEYREVGVVPPQHRLQEGRHIDLGEPHLFPGREEGAKIQGSAAAGTTVVGAPHGVPLSVIGAINVDGRLEERLVGVAELDPVIEPETVEAGNISVVGPVEGQEADILDHNLAARGKILAVDGRDRDDSADVEIEIKAQVRVVGVACEAVERDRVGHRLPSARVSDEGNAAHVDESEEWILLVAAEALELLQVLEQEPAASVVLSPDSAVDEVLVDTREDVSPACQEISEVIVSGIREVAHVVVSVHHEHQGEGAVPVGIPHPGVEGHLLRREAPVIVAFVRGATQVHECRSIHRRRDDRYGIPVLGPPEVCPAAVVEGEHGVGSAHRRVRCLDQLAIEKPVGIVRREPDRRITPVDERAGQRGENQSAEAGPEHPAPRFTAVLFSLAGDRRWRSLEGNVAPWAFKASLAGPPAGSERGARGIADPVPMGRVLRRLSEALRRSSAAGWRRRASRTTGPLELGPGYPTGRSHLPISYPSGGSAPRRWRTK